MRALTPDLADAYIDFLITGRSPTDPLTFPATATPLT